MKRLLIDASSVMKASLWAAVSGPSASVVEFEGKDEIIPSQIDGYEIWLTSLQKTLETLNMVPSQCILVKDGRNASELRRQFLPGYRVRKPRPPEFSKEFYEMLDRAEENLLSYGAVSVVKEKVEADDFIFALSQVLDSIVWSGDGDLLAAGDLFYQGQINDPLKFMGVDKKHIVVYKSLIGDPSDAVPGAKGFGESAFRDMLIKYGSDSLDEFLEMLEKRTLQDLAPFVDEFKPFKKILDSEELVYASYNCVRPHHPGWDDIVWKARYPKGDSTWKNWDLKIELITKDKLTSAFIQKFKQQLAAVPWGPSFDIETWSDEASLAWGIANKTQRGPRLDVYGQHLSGFSITTGPNNNLVYYFPVDHADTENIALNDMTMLLNCCDEKKPLFVFNAGFELPVVRKHLELRFDRGWLPNVHDVLIMKSYVNENTPLALKYCSKTYLDYQQVTFEEVTTEKPAWTEDGEDEAVDDYEPVPSRQMNEMTGQEVVDYGADDSICTGALANLYEIIMRYEGTWNAYEMCELAPAYLCAEAFLNGQKFDLDRLAELTVENEIESAKLWKQINEKLIDIEWTVGDELSGAFYTEKLPGCIFLPAQDLSGSELKKVYQQVTGESLKSNLRSVEKLATLMQDKAPDLTAALTLDDSELELENSADLQLERFNAAGEKLFVPKPELNLGSPKQMTAFLYEALGFPIRLRGKVTDKMRAAGKKQGNPKGNESAVRHAIMYDADEEQKELLLLLIKAKALQTDAGLYLKPYPKMPNPKDGFVHPNPGICRTTSRRAAPQGPNFSQCSKKSPIREVYVPPEEDLIWWSMDFSGQELRLTAERSQCEIMLACYPKDGPAKDLHSVTAVEVAAVAGRELTYEQIAEGYDDTDNPMQKELKKFRNDSKAVNFGDVYGQTEVGLAEKLLITVEKAREIIAAKAAAFPGVAQWKKDVEERILRDGYASTLLGARKHLVLDGSWKDGHEIRSGINFEIQSPAGEQLKQVQRKFWERQIFERYEAGYAMSVHDECDGWVTREDVLPFLKEAHAIMLEKYATMEVPIESSIEIGRNFGTLISIGTKFDEEKLKEVIDKL